MIDVPRLLELLGIDAKRKGRDLWARCPFPDHKDGEPSWHIEDRPGTERHGSHHCFGCHQGGGPVDLVMAMIGTSFPSARAWLVDQGIETDDLGSAELGVELELVDRLPKAELRMPPEFRGGPIVGWPEPARRYAMSRGITAAQVRGYGLGYAVEGRLRGRLVFPFFGEDGRLEGYSARTYVGSELRYLTPRREEGASEDAVFGAHRWPARGGREVVVAAEGAINALACGRASGLDIAALSGSLPTPGQIERLASFGRVLVATDPDQAGEWAAELIGVLARWTRVERVAIDGGKDAQSMSRAGLATAIEEALCATW